MRATHLLIPIIMMSVVSVLLQYIVGFSGIQTHLYIYVIVFAVSFVIGVHLSWQVGRFIGIPPLSIFLGPCPNCGQRPRGWLITNGRIRTWRRLPANVELACGSCLHKVVLWLGRNVPGGTDTATMATFCLRWPELFGVWRRVAGSP